MSLSYDEVAEILRLIDNSSCDEFVVETGDLRLVVRRNGAAAPVAPAREPTLSPLRTSSTQPERVESRTARPKPKLAAGQAEIVAPMVGTFYRAQRPEAPPFVEMGSIVRAGQPLCLIEVMKLFTTINSDVDGRIVHIGAENGELVEYGHTLFVLDPI